MELLKTVTAEFAAWQIWAVIFKQVRRGRAVRSVKLYCIWLDFSKPNSWCKI